MTNPADIPHPLPWEDRSKTVEAMPRGNSNYVETLREICGHIVNQELSHTDLVKWLQDRFDLKARPAAYKGGFLHKAGIVGDETGLLRLSDHANIWYTKEDDGILIALLHSRFQFIGEMLVELNEEPLTLKELTSSASNYGLTWTGTDQVGRRGKWLQSAKMIMTLRNGRIAITDAGRHLGSRLDLHKSSERTAHPQPFSTPTPPETGPEVDYLNSPLPDALKLDEPTPSTLSSKSDGSPSERDHSPAEVLAHEIRGSSTDSKNPDRLEIAVRDAFHFLGFDTEWLGGSGKTDVLVKAPLGKGDSYSATIDAKTAGSGSLSYGQVNFDTLNEHRNKHDADYSMLVGPNPTDQRLMGLAADKPVAVLSTDQLADLCLQHADTPLGLQDYRALFETGGAFDTVSIGKAAQALTRLRGLAVEICSKLAERTGAFGPLTASQLMVMVDQPDPPSSEQEIQQVLDTLASPLLGVIQGTADKGYILATAPRVIQQRLHQLGDHLAILESPQDQ